MKKRLHGLWLVLFLFIPLVSYGQIPWSSEEDTCYVRDLFGTGQFLNQIIAADTAGTGWKGASGATAWQNHTRVYVLQKFGMYPWSAAVQLRANRKLVIRAEDGNYAPGADWKPQIYGYPTAGAYPGRFINLNQLGDTLILKNISICGVDESQLGGLDKVQGNMIEIQSTGSGSIFIDSCMLKTINGQLMQIGASGACHANTLRISNTLFADMGFLGMSNFGAGRGIDMRNSEVDSLDIQNCTFVNFQDRIVRHLLSLQPIHTIKFNHNTVINGMSYCGTISLGWVDSLGNGPFEIKDNLFVDNFAMGPDTDAVRASEFTDSGDKDPVKGAAKISWFCARPNTTVHITPWVISNNYYCITDSGEAIRAMASPYLRVPPATLFPGAEEPILTSDMKRQLQANGGDTLTAFRKVTIKLADAPPLMTRMIRWYYSVESDGTGGNDQSNVGAGAGRKKTGSSGTPASHFIHDVTNNVWVYDFNRRTTGWYFDTLDCRISGSAFTVASLVSSDGRVVGDPRWGTPVISGPAFSKSASSITFGQVYVDSTKKDSVAVSNIGTDTLKVTAISSSNARFTFAPATLTVVPGGVKYLVITFAPTDTNSQSGSVVLTHNAESSPDTVAVSGKGKILSAVEPDPSGIPTEYSLRQNYPNPFNPSTTIEFGVPERTSVELAVYNLLGERIAVLVREELPAGFYKTTFDGRQLPSGIYFYRIQAGSYVQTRKLILVK